MCRGISLNRSLCVANTPDFVVLKSGALDLHSNVVDDCEQPLDCKHLASYCFKNFFFVLSLCLVLVACVCLR